MLATPEPPPAPPAAPPEHPRLPLTPASGPDALSLISLQCRHLAGGTGNGTSNGTGNGIGITTGTSTGSGRRRKQAAPRRGAEPWDPSFRGVTLRMRLGLPTGSAEGCRLLITARGSRLLAAQSVCLDPSLDHGLLRPSVWIHVWVPPDFWLPRPSVWMHPQTLSCPVRLSGCIPGLLCLAGCTSFRHPWNLGCIVCLSGCTSGHLGLLCPSVWPHLPSLQPLPHQTRVPFPFPTGDLAAPQGWDPPVPGVPHPGGGVPHSGAGPRFRGGPRTPPTPFSCRGLSRSRGSSPPAGPPRAGSSSEDDAPLAQGSKRCASCKTRRTPLWRAAENGTPLCNACGIRYKKYRVRCRRCWNIPGKSGTPRPQCPHCGERCHPAGGGRR
ncbi:GATA-type zinc finger protein 1 isoform X2 [Phalacrocorax carbo]|uniref:GATA-type zinc finger protein 1 isoform X2 n=1 Tax=Phalacrocorax carbo TaxID=9209 RepID=UPI0031198481